MKPNILSLFILLIASAVYSQDINLLKSYNGDFEDGISFWRFFEVPDNIGSAWQITNDAVSGSKATKITYVAADETIQDRGFDNWSAGVPVIAGTEYTLKAFIKSDEASGLKVSFLIGFFTSDNSVISPQFAQDFALTTSYTDHEFTITAPEGASSCWVAFRMYDAGNQRAAGTMYLDDVRLMGPSTALSPRVMITTLPSDDVPIASINVSEEPFSAKKDGSADATSAFQDAINRASLAGGAVVFVPAGTYRFDGTLNIPERVILRGEWENPDSIGAVTGTILMAYDGQGSEEGDPFISVQRGAGIKNLSIWYPEQTISTVNPYPWTIHCHPDGAAGAGDNTSVINVTLVNAYNGIKVGPNWNELHYIRNVYGTPLNQGIWLSQTTDIGRLVDVHLEPKYWSESGLSNAPSQEAIVSYLHSSPSTGIIMGRSDWEYIYDVSLIGYQTGMQIIKYTDMGPNGVIYGLHIEKSKIGIDLVNLNPIGWAISNSIIKAEGENSACIRAGDAFSSVVQFNTCTFGGDPETAVLFSGSASGRLSFQNCTFEQWGQSGDGPAIDCNSGALSLLGNTFMQDKPQLRFGTSLRNAQILDNSFPSGLKIDDQSYGEVLVSQEALNWTRQEVPSHPYATFPRPATNDLYDIMDYGAIADGSTDNSTAIQEALDAAGLNGGGTVYIPAGMYKVNSHLTVPSGVELRGIYDVPHHTASRGSILLAYEGKENAEGTPFISMESGSGVRGFTVWYPEQSTQDFFPYPWTIQTLGENCWVKDVCLSNTYQGVDMASYPSAGHMVSYLCAAPLKTGISVDKSMGDGWIENVQFNPHYWMRSPGYPKSTELDINAIIPFQQSTLEAFKLATATREHVMGTFVFAAKHGLYLAPDNGTSNIDIIQHGTDAGDNAIYLENKAGSKVNFVNTQLVLLGATQTGIITSASGFDADVSFYNSISWGGPGPTTNLNGSGNILIQQMHTHNNTFKINNGKARLENIAISSSLNPHYILGAGTDKFNLFGSYARNGFVVYNYVDDKSAVETDYIYKRNYKESTFTTGWESGEIQNSWDNTLFGHKDSELADPDAYQCEALDTDTTHTGLRALKIAGAKIDEAAPYFKIFDSRISVLNNSTFSYWLNPQNESGKTGHMDLLFTDGTRLSELSALADDGLALDAARGVIGEWIEVRCSLWKYAAGKTIQTILVGADLDADETYSFFLDDLTTTGVVSVNPSIADHPGLSLDQNHPNPFADQTYLRYQLDQPGLVTLSVYNMLGQQISILTEGQHQSVGSHEMSWTPEKLEAGIYFCRLEFLSDQGEKKIRNRKMILAE